MKKRILVIFESEAPRPEAIQYSRELSRRMDSDLVLLHLAHDRSTDLRGTRQIAQGLTDAGLPTRVDVKYGDPRSELLKYIAMEPSFMAVVWGGPVDVVQGAGRSSAHWLSLVHEDLGCPLITMHRKGELAELYGRAVRSGKGSRKESR